MQQPSVPSQTYAVQQAVAVSVPAVSQVGVLQLQSCAQVWDAGQPVMLAQVTGLQPHPPSAVGLAQVGQVHPLLNNWSQVVPSVQPHPPSATEALHAGQVHEVYSSAQQPPVPVVQSTVGH